MPNRARRLCLASVAAAVLAVGMLPATAGTPTASAPPAPGSPAYLARDAQNVAAAYGRQTGPGGQLTPTYLTALAQVIGPAYEQQVLAQAATPTHPVLDPGQLVPGWNVGNPLRSGWDGTRGHITPVSYTNRYGALIRGDLFTPLAGAHDPYTGAPLHAQYPAVVITTGSIQGSSGMYWWAAEDLAERGYLVMTYDVQGQGTSETLPHPGGSTLPFCNPVATPVAGETTGCPGVPFQQTSNFVYGTEDAISYLLSTPQHPYATNSYDPLWRAFDRSPDRQSVTPGRTTRLAIVGHSLGATAISYVQAVDPRVEAAVAFDKLTTTPGFTALGAMRPVVPSLGVQSEYFLNPTPYYLDGDTPSSPQQAPDPAREEKTGFDGWRAAGVDSMVIVPRASTHLEYTDIPLALPASRYGQDIASAYTQDWLGYYLKHQSSAYRALLAPTIQYLEPVGDGHWSPVTLARNDNLSIYFCSGYAVHGPNGHSASNLDLNDRGCR